MNKDYTIGIAGLWHLGSIYSAGLAELGNNVVGYDKESKVVMQLQSAQPPVYEPDLSALIKKNLGTRLAYTVNPADLRKCQVFWLTIDTAIDEHGRPDLSAAKETVKAVASYWPEGVVVVVSSQLPVGTATELKSLIRALRPELDFCYVYQPENLQLGRAVASFMKPARLVVGLKDERARTVITDIFAPLACPLHFMNVASAEMVKHALNGFLATSLSFIYDIADLCEQYGADVLEVSRALKSDARIGPAAYLDAGLGFSGGTLERDLAVLTDKAAACGITIPVAAGALAKNQERYLAVLSFLQKEIKDLSSASVAVLGLTYKPGTSTLRHSLSLKLMSALSGKVKQIHCHDPLADRQEASDDTWLFFDDVYDMLSGCQAAILMTAWPEYQELDFKKMAEVMTELKIFFDAKNFLADRETEIRRAGLSYRGIGRGQI